MKDIILILQKTKLVNIKSRFQYISSPLNLLRQKGINTASILRQYNNVDNETLS